MLLSFAIIGFLHWKWGVIQPLLLQSIMPLKNIIFDSQLFQIHLFNKAASGTLQRPWKVENPFQ